MPIAAKLMVADPNIPLPIYEADIVVFRLPVVGDNWWGETFAARVTRADEQDGLPRIHIERDPDRTAALYQGLPARTEIGANLDPDTGVWEVHVQEPGGRLLGHARGADADEGVLDVAARARDQALAG